MPNINLSVKETVAILMILAGAAGLYTAISTQLSSQKVRIETLESSIDGQNEVNVHILETLNRIKRDVAVIKDRQERDSIQNRRRRR